MSAAKYGEKPQACRSAAPEPAEAIAPCPFTAAAGFHERLSRSVLLRLQTVKKVEVQEALPPAEVWGGAPKPYAAAHLR